MTTSDNEWQRVVQEVAQRVTTSYNEWQRITTSDNEWQLVVISSNFLFFRIREETTNKRSNENPLKPWAGSCKGPNELKAAKSP